MFLENILYRFGKDSTRVEILRKRGAIIGKNCMIAPNVSFGSEPYLIRLGDNVKLSNGVTLVTHDGGMYVIRNLMSMNDADTFGTITIGNNVFIGNKAAVLPNVRIGNNVIIGYGAVVTRDIPDNSIAAGVPARIIKSVDEYYEKIKNSIHHVKYMKYDEKKKYLTDHFCSAANK